MLLVYWTLAQMYSNTVLVGPFLIAMYVNVRAILFGCGYLHVYANLLASTKM
jgi:hypothetical protein